MLETQAEQDGLVDAPIKHAPEHFEWLALYHFGKWTVERIAGEFGGKHGLEDRSIFATGCPRGSGASAWTLSPSASSSWC